MRKLLFILILLPLLSFSQVMVNGKDVNQESTTLEVWCVAKPFSTKESYFADFGQDKFRPSYYDHKSQALYDKDNNKFEKGKWVSLEKYLTKEGWEIVSERPTNIGEQQGRIVTFKRS